MVVKNNIISIVARLTAIVTLGFSVSAANAGDLSIVVKDDDGAPLEHAVVQLTPKFDFSAPPTQMANAEMRQRNTLFEPFVLPVRVGTSVSFPNLDEARHHVYSFSRAKPFELRLYGKDESNSITFDNTGVVALGCNIHDNMLAYILVTDAPIYVTTGESGMAAFTDLENGVYDISIWHPGQKNRDSNESWSVEVTDAKVTQDVQIELRRVWGQQRDPAEGQY